MFFFGTQCTCTSIICTDYTVLPFAARSQRHSSTCLCPSTDTAWLLQRCLFGLSGIDYCSLSLTSDVTSLIRRELHWLLMAQRTEYKLWFSVYKLIVSQLQTSHQDLYTLSYPSGYYVIPRTTELLSLIPGTDSRQNAKRCILLHPCNVSGKHSRLL